MKNSEKHYITFDPKVGYPTGKDLFYECVKCGDILPSLPKDSISCACKNLYIDIYYGRLAVEDKNLLKIFST